MPIGLPRMGQMGGRSTPMSELNQAIALLRSVGGRMYLPGLTSRVAADGSGAVPVAGDVVGYVPDLVSGGLGPELVTKSSHTFQNATISSSVQIGAVSNPQATQYRLSFDYDLSAGSARVLVYGSSQHYAPAALSGSGSFSGIITLFTAGGSFPNQIRVQAQSECTTGVVTNISVREVTAITQATTAAKPKLIREPILGPELVVNGGFDSASGWGTSDGWSIGSGVATKIAGTAFSAVSCKVPYTQFDTAKQYHVTLDYTSSASIVVYLRGSAQTTLPASTTTRRATWVTNAGTSTASSLSVGASSTTTATIDNISVREILGYTERYSLEFDGVDDYMSASSAATLSDGLVMVWSGRKLDASAQDRLVALWDTATTTEAAISTTGAGVEVKLRVPGYGEFSGAAADFSVGAVTTVALRITASTASIRVNGGAWVNASHGRVLPGTLLSFGVSARPNGTLPATQAISAAMVANLGANATDANIAILERAAAQAVGITL